MTSNNYVGVADDWSSEQVVVWERGPEGRTSTRFDNPYYFYIPHPEGQHTSMYGDPLTKVSFDNREEFKAAKAHFPLKFESDFTPLDKVLMDNYYGLPAPALHYSFFDIEVDIDETGFPLPSLAIQPINAITLYNKWEDKFYCLAVPPPEWSEGVLIPDTTKYNYEKISLEYFQVFNEAELLSVFLDLIEDCDFISGWNSEFFDIVYIYNRITKVLGEKAASRLCFPGAPPPRVREVERFGKEEMVVQLFGRSHLDYLAMFKKFTFEGRSSYALGSICEEELKVSKLEYDGSLYDLYHFNFETFVTYNIIDVLLLKKLDLKFNFVQLVNQMAHENTVQFDAILGTTKYVDAGTTNFARHFLQVIVKNKDVVTKHGKIEGAIVLTPHKGLHEFVGSVDINSLYPSVIRSLNSSPETYIGQFSTEETFERMKRLPEVQDLVKQSIKGGVDLDTFFLAMSKEADWKGISEKDEYPHTALIGMKYITKTGKEWNEFLREKKWVVSAYGTIFDQSGAQGIVPAVLTFWASERKKLQKELKVWKNKAKELREQNVIPV